MRRNSRALVLFCLLLATSGHAYAAANTCSLPSGLYSRLEELDTEYAQRVGNNYVANKAEADRINAQRERLYNKYKPFFSTLCSAIHDKDTELIAHCCALTNGDPAAEEMCELASYMADESAGAIRFIDKFPETAGAINALWRLDQIALGRHGPRAAECGDAGPAYIYMDRLSRFVGQGNRQATRKFVNLSNYTDGAYAEELDDRLMHLLLQNPRLVLEQWSILHNYSHIDQIGLLFNQSERATAQRNFRSLCQRPSKRCEEILRAISSGED